MVLVPRLGFVLAPVALENKRDMEPGTCMRDRIHKLEELPSLQRAMDVSEEERASKSIFSFDSRRSELLSSLFSIHLAEGPNVVTLA